MKTTSPPAKSALLKALIAFAIAAGIIAFLFYYTGTRRGPSPAERETFFKQSVTPILVNNTFANTKALEALDTNIHTQFEQYRGRVPNFTADITGFGNKAKITWEAVRQLASGDQKKVERHVTEKFEMNVVSAKRMQEDMETLLKGFCRDIEANRNRMLVDIEAAVKENSQMSPRSIKLQDVFAEEINGKISQLAKNSGHDVALMTSLNLLASLAADYAVTTLVKAALVRTGASLLTIIAASGGTAATLTAGGGTVGLAEGPAGFVIGLAAGCIVGYIVDSVMSDRLEKKLNSECTDFLTKAETSLTKDKDGLIQSLDRALVEMQRIQSPVINHQLEVLP